MLVSCTAYAAVNRPVLLTGVVERGEARSTGNSGCTFGQVSPASKPRATATSSKDCPAGSALGPLLRNSALIAVEVVSIYRSPDQVLKSE